MCRLCEREVVGCCWNLCPNFISAVEGAKHYCMAQASTFLSYICQPPAGNPTLPHHSTARDLQQSVSHSMSSPWTFFSAGPSPPGPKPSPDGAFEAPTRHDRKKCWEARDSFFRCLDQHGIIDSIKDFAQADKQCGSQEMDLRKECATSWVRETLHGPDCTSDHDLGDVLLTAPSDGAQKEKYARRISERGCDGSSPRHAVATTWSWKVRQKR